MSQQYLRKIVQSMGVVDEAVEKGDGPKQGRKVGRTKTSAKQTEAGEENRKGPRSRSRM